MKPYFLIFPVDKKLQTFCQFTWLQY